MKKETYYRFIFLGIAPILFINAYVLKENFNQISWDQAVLLVLGGVASFVTFFVMSLENRNRKLTFLTKSIAPESPIKDLLQAESQILDSKPIYRYRNLIAYIALALFYPSVLLWSYLILARFHGAGGVVLAWAMVVGLLSTGLAAVYCLFRFRKIFFYIDVADLITD